MIREENLEAVAALLDVQFSFPGKLCRSPAGLSNQANDAIHWREIVAGKRTPGPQNPSANPENIHDGTNSLQVTPPPSTAGYWQNVEAAADGVYATLSTRLASFSNQTLSSFSLRWSLYARYGDHVAETAEAYFQHVLEEVKNAADWDSLNKTTAPLLGQVCFEAGVLVGAGESLAGDVRNLLGLLKMLALAAIYVRTRTPSTLVVDPLAAVMVLAVKYIPAFGDETKAAYDELQKMMEDLFKIAKHPLDFISAVGKNAWKGAQKDLNDLAFYANQNTDTSEFEAGRIAGRVLYQVIQAILLVVGTAEVVAKLASKIPALMEVAGIVNKGGDLEKLTALSKVEEGGGAAEAAAKGPKFQQVSDFGKSGKAAAEPKPEAPAAPAAPAAPSVTRSYGKNTATWFKDEQGRTVRVEADLKESYTGLKRGADEVKAQKAAAAMGEEGDAGGHMVGHRFMGDQGEKNLFPQEGNFNNSAYKKMENELADWTRQGKEVKLNISMDPPGADRPDIVSVQYDVVDPASGKIVYSNAQDFENDVGQTFQRVTAKDMATNPKYH
jgi:hypothetical protein